MSRLRKDVEALTLGKKKARGKLSLSHLSAFAKAGVDYDPEDEHIDSEHKDDGTSGSEEEFGGREHYQAVGKSRLRKQETAPLDSKYGGVAVSRKALEVDEDDDDDPFAPQDDDDDNDPFDTAGADKGKTSDEEANVDLHQDVGEIDEDDSIDSDEAFGESDDGKFKKFKFRGSKSNRVATEDDEAASDEEASDVLSESEDDDVSDEVMDGMDDVEEDLEHDSDDDDDDDDDDDASEDVDEESDAVEEEQDRPSTSKKREDLKAYLSTEAKTLASNLSQAASADAKKGVAVKRQYSTFDRLLDARIKLQKGFTASDELATNSSSFGSEAEGALKRAQDAALQLYNTINSFRHSFTPMSTSISDSQSKKRKRSSPATNLDDLDSMWTTMQEFENELLPWRRTTLDKWSGKIKVSDPTRAPTAGKAKFLDSAADEKLTAVLNTYIINEQDKHFRSQAEDQEAAQSEDEHKESFKYDDTFLYQSLLRDLITTRSATNTTSIPIITQKLHPSGNRQNKSVRDTKASKGRKIRYTVHEKLQNFMAAEGDTGRDTAMWTERGKDEFFGSLFGQDRALMEDDDEEMEGGEDVDGAEVEALRLFRT
ncbi:rRNA-processing protein bfr2 [Neophaeococcomyces mojaviensis]|uniref:rRNA-processing protein bfr2 n=1 Tax=Neophaeococcomyces mojaviensis TaxID=3383035 RepID=A0ACC3A953_9EURO|nr:rRNA-processing protein bfr2 [Knufia sp. JES_112]